MKLVAHFESKKNKDYFLVELGYSYFMRTKGGEKWFCRIWRKDWLDDFKIGKSWGESYGKNKFEAYRLAKINLNHGKTF